MFDILQLFLSVKKNDKKLFLCELLSDLISFRSIPFQLNKFFIKVHTKITCDFKTKKKNIQTKFGYSCPTNCYLKGRLIILYGYINCKAVLCIKNYKLI